MAGAKFEVKPETFGVTSGKGARKRRGEGKYQANKVRATAVRLGKWTEVGRNQHIERTASNQDTFHVSSSQRGRGLASRGGSCE